MFSTNHRHCPRQGRPVPTRLRAPAHKNRRSTYKQIVATTFAWPPTNLRNCGHMAIPAMQTHSYTRGGAS